jgi:hypothetical protein
LAATTAAATAAMTPTERELADARERFKRAGTKGNGLHDVKRLRGR